MIAEIAQAANDSLSLNPINRWVWVFPVVESIHICGFALLVGTIAVLDLRLSDLCLTRQSINRLAEVLAPWIYLGIAIQFVTGPYLFSASPHDYVHNPSFRMKMMFLAAALIFHFTVVRGTAGKTEPLAPVWRRLVAVVSMGLWIGVILGGLGIGFWAVND
ncbi:MAG TPA: DUF6644 family protein [Candidatus Dormibacteraeota bacterium]|nr:DUF6644 family protein [Candidatus Dormibacteraeota bacterium]